MERFPVGILGVSTIGLEVEIKATFPYDEPLCSLANVLKMIPIPNYESNEEPS